MYGIVLILVLVATGGIIAFIGDRLGTKIGKKRLSLFGLRPRYTSTIVTIFTGFLITATTLGIMSIISRDVRTALFGMEQLNKDLQTSRENLYLVSNSLEKVQTELQNSKNEVSSLKAEQISLQEVNSTLTEENTSLTEINSTLTEENTSLTEINSTLTEENTNLSEINSTLSEENTSLTEINSTLSEENSNLSAKNSALLQSNTDLAEINSDLSEMNTQLETQKQNLQNGLISMRAGDIAYNAGEILASGKIAGGSSESELAEKIQSMTKDLSIWIYQPDFENANRIVANAKSDLIVRLIAAGNLIRGEPVRADIEIYPNKKVFHAGEFIVGKILDIQSKDEVESLVMTFLHENVNEVAQERGILKDPIKNSVGVIEGSQFYALVGELQKIHGKAKITAYARDDTDAMGPLRLNFKIEEFK